MPIANIELIMMALVAILAAQHFPHKVDDWEGLPSTCCTWKAWKQSFHLAHFKRWHQILALGGGGGILGGSTVLFLQWHW
jgi:hypothetical protein